MSGAKTARVEIKEFRALVRDKDGNPKIANEKMYQKFYHRLSEEDKIHLKEKYGYGSSNDNRT